MRIVRLFLKKILLNLVKFSASFAEKSLIPKQEQKKPIKLKTMYDERIQDWILVGYEVFAQEGPNGLKVELLARKVGKSKSSFYHFFADLEVFTEFLLGYHLERAKIVAAEENACKNMVPDLLNVLLDAKTDLFFSRQLRVHRNIPEFKKCFEKANNEIGDAFMKVWADSLGLSHRDHLAQAVLDLVLENFYLQISEENLTYEWLLSYLQQISFTVKELQRSGKEN